MPVNPDGTAVYIVETHQQLHHRSLARTGRSDDRDLLPVFDIRRKIMHNDLIRLIAERHMVELHISLQPLDAHRMLGNLRFFLLIEKLKHTLRGSRRGLQHVRHLRELLDRLREIADILEE